MSSPAPQISGLVYVQPLGQGGFADVYLYEQQTPRMPVAVKVLKGTGITPTVTAEFLAEADTMAALGDHPYIVQVFRAGTAADGRPYLVMKYYPPPNLAQRARAERFAVADVLRMGIQLASAVETAHQASIIHRDIKPANVLLSAYGAPGLTDFGIAGRGLRSQSQAVSQGVSAREEMGVSVPWSPPEVVYGESNGDPRSDVYSLAATLWQLLTGRSPFEVPGGDNTAYALMPRIRNAPVPATGRPDVPPSLERLLGQAMAKDPAHRPQTAMELARALQSVEQELRLPRTQILVLDDRGRASLTGPTIRPQLPASPAPVEDRTHVKGPQRVQAQPPVAPARPPAARTSPPGGSGMPAPPVPPPPLPHGLPANSPASAVASVPSPPAPATGQPGMPRAPGAEAATDTPLRPSWDADTQGFADPSIAPQPVPPARPASPWLRAAVVVGALLALGLGWVFLKPASTPPTVGPVPTIAPTTDSVAIDGVFQPPILTAEPRPGAVHFAWTYDAPEPKDTFRVWLGANQDEATHATPTQPTTPTFDAPATTGTRVCAIVAVVRHGQRSPSSVLTCAAAG